MTKRCKGCNSQIDEEATYCDDCIADEENLKPWEFVTGEEEREA